MAGANSPEQSDSSAPAQGTDKSVKPSMTYILGPADQIDIWALGAEELSGKPLRIDAAGYVDVPTVGPVKAGGLTLEQLKADEVRTIPDCRPELMMACFQPVVVGGYQSCSVSAECGSVIRAVAELLRDVFLERAI